MQKPRSRPDSKRGTTLVELIISIVLLALLSLGLASYFRSQFQTTQNSAAHSGITDLSDALNLAFNAATCATAGAYQAAGAPAAVVKSGANYTLALDTIQFPSGVNALSPGSPSIIAPLSISATTLTFLGGNGPNPNVAGGLALPFQMQIAFSSPAGAGPPPPPLTKFFTVYTDATDKVVGACAGSQAANLQFIQSL